MIYFIEFFDIIYLFLSNKNSLSITLGNRFSLRGRSRNILPDKSIFKIYLKNNFIEEYEDYKYAKWFSSTLFNKWVSKYCDYKAYELEKNSSNGQRWISITGKDNETEDFFKPTQEVPF